MKDLQLSSVTWKEDKYFVAQCLDVDVSSFGETRAEALANLQEALELYFEDKKQPKVTKVQRPALMKHRLRCA